VGSIESLCDNISGSPAAACIEKTEASLEVREQPLREEQPYERLLQALAEMQAQIEERVRPVVAQVVQAEIDRLRTLSERHQNHLNDCLAHIDENILSCRDHLHEYRRVRSDLVSLQQRLTELGAEPVAPVAIVGDVLSDNLSDILTCRVERLQLAGKI